ncbi:MAG: 16S rRNA (cytosine1402-N4)-methyltransferase [Cellvibrionaceae bacterium]
MVAEQEHITVLLKEAVTALLSDADGFYVDGTFGRGGHSEMILGEMSRDGRLLAIDKDEQAVATGISMFGQDPRFDIAQGSFANLQSFLEARQVMGKVSGILLDLGVSSPQLQQATRGFSFKHDGPLDMRMDQSAGQTASEWVNRASDTEIVRILREYGEERFAKRMARAILNARAHLPITTTAQLAKIIADANPAWERGKHPATRAFQAIRIFINNELGDLQEVLAQSLEALSIGGRLVVISFHSLEDRMVKRFIKSHERDYSLPIGVPVTEDYFVQRLRRLGKAVKPSAGEIQANPRARSAIMRVAEKLV